MVGLNGLALCGGVGGLERGIESVFVDFRTVCYVEGEAYAAACLISQMEKGWIYEAPVWSNVRTFDGKPWRRKVDIISGGFPCQPFSKAGKQKGKDDERHLWPDISRIIGEVQPSIVILENVPNVIDYAGTDIFGDLAKMGYNSAWGIVRASDANAPHQRARFFSISINTDAYNDGLPLHLIKEDCHGRIVGTRTLEGSRIEGFCSNVSNTNNKNEAMRGKHKAVQKPIFCGQIDSSRSIDDGREGHNKKTWKTSENVPNPNGKGLEVWGCITKNIEEKFEATKRSHQIERIPTWSIEPELGRVADGVAYRVDRLRACGNGVVPQQARLALEILISKLNGVELWN